MCAVADNDVASTEQILQNIANKLKLVKYSRTGDGYYGLEVKDSEWFTQTEKIEVSTKGGIGLELVEIMNSGDGGGLIAIGGIRKDSNADKTQKFKIGDLLVRKNVYLSTTLVNHSFYFLYQDVSIS